MEREVRPYDHTGAACGGVSHAAPGGWHPFFPACRMKHRPVRSPAPPERWWCGRTPPPLRLCAGGGPGRRLRAPAGGPSHTYSEFGPLTLFGEYEALCGQIAFWPRCVPEPPAGFGCSPGRTTSPGSSPAGTPPSPGYGRWCAACGSRPGRERGYLSLDSDSRLLSFLVSWYEANAGGGTAASP